MIEFTNKGFNINVETGLAPVEAWHATVDEMITLLQNKNTDIEENFYFTLEILRAMMPDVTTAHKMLPTEK